MNKNTFPFHIQQNTDLNMVVQAVTLGCYGEISPAELAERTGKTETDILKRIRAPLRQMGVLNRWDLAPFGKRLATLRDERPELLGEAMHIQLYTLHWRNPTAYFSFAYAALCEWLCERGEYNLDGDGQSELVGVVLRRAAETYALDSSGIAFSKSSVQGATHWLQATEPPTLEDSRFHRRHAAPLYSLLWVVEALYARQDLPRGTRLTLDEATEKRLCGALLLDPDALRRTLDVAQTAFDYRRGGGFFGIGTEGGFGRWILLTRSLPVGSLDPTDDTDPDIDAAAMEEADREDNEPAEAEE